MSANYNPATPPFVFPDFASGNYNSTVPGRNFAVETVDSAGKYESPTSYTVQGVASRDANSLLAAYVILNLLFTYLICVCALYGVYLLSSNSSAADASSYTQWVLLLLFTGVFLLYNYFFSDLSRLAALTAAPPTEPFQDGGDAAVALFYAPLHVCASVVLFLALFIAFCLYFALYTAGFFLAIIFVGICHFFYHMHFAQDKDRAADTKNNQQQ